ncbi:MAG: HNH endonuclease family protein, partial [Sulfobacillus sp.]
PGLRYFLYEYELSLFDAAVQQKVNWDDLLKTEKDKISIEHIYPQTETAQWAVPFKGVGKKMRSAFGASLGNLLLLSAAINSSLQNDSFDAKKS